MARPPLDVGTHGKIRFSDTATGVRARASYRGFDGKVHDIERTGPTRPKAERLLKKAISEALKAPGGGDIDHNTKFGVVADRWLARQAERVEAGERAHGTLDNYRSMLKNHVLPALGDLRLHEVTVPRLDAFLPGVKAKTSASHARTARAVVSGILGYAVRQGALGMNPVRELERIEGGKRKKPRALSSLERRRWLEQLEADSKAAARDLPDLTRFMLATGVRIGEALAVFWEDVDLDAGTVAVDWKVIRIRKVGLRRVKKLKSESGDRTLPLPSWAVSVLRERRRLAEEAGRGPATPVFPDTIGGLRDPSNTRRDLREARGTEDFAWVKSHVFRKTAATVLDDAKLSPRQIADQLGHARPSITQDVYMGRTTVSRDNAIALENMWSDDDPTNSGGKPGAGQDEQDQEAP
ncbi:tyrosine-type recombinase/integrase [Amycolatopsis pittospori]|uniref:tyrosine-type recombinase/integrase n=1 Tax=Amycolatopsis pittospori TaxID=2749434 RepID=UPI001F296E4D|nr:site-specific integrase [Amycolatopsis pittospori]